VRIVAKSTSAYTAAMSLDSEAGRAIVEILRGRGYTGEIGGDLPLGTGGLALDSIAIVEVLLACEERFGIVIATELLAGKPLTVARLAGRMQRSIQRSIEH
jgi:acyl carrier protein